MSVPTDYLPFLDGERPIPSWLVARLPPGHPEPAIAAIMRRLDDSGLDVGDLRVAGQPDSEDALWAIALDLPPHGAAGGRRRLGQVWLDRAESLDELHLGPLPLPPEELEAARRSEWVIGFSTTFGDRPLVEFHEQLRLVAAAVPEAQLVVDLAACRVHSASWVTEAAASAAPPSPETLFCVHAVESDTGDGSWLHSHGLLRCGAIELEILDVPAEHVGACGRLLNAAASLFVERGVPEPGSPFLLGDELVLSWIPWQEAVPSRGEALGGRDDWDGAHSHPSGVLFAPQRRLGGLLGRRRRNPAVYAEALEGDPVLFISNMETERMALLAHERLYRFRELHQRFGAHEEWCFLVKLGYPIDDAEGPKDREHLWHRVHAFDGDCVDATLVNQPRHVAGMTEGQRQQHSLDCLSDWTILSEHGPFGPDHVLVLEQVLERDQTGAEPDRTRG